MQSYVFLNKLVLAVVLKTSRIHDHYVPPIKDIPIQLKPTTIFIRKNRYECPFCGKSFYPSK